MSTMRGKIIVSVVALAVLALVGGAAVFSAFSSTSASSTNTFVAGTVALSSDGSGSSLFDLPNMKPGDNTSWCVQVSYTGTLAATVGLSGTETGNLAQYVTATIVRGTFPGSPPANNACTGFTPDTTGSAVWTGVLNTVPTAGTPLLDAGSWTAGTSHVYEITIALPTNAVDAAQGQTATAGFTWQAQNS
jgi:hypothetical protein